MAHQSTTPADSSMQSTDANAGTNASAPSLARGKACLRCRKRKMRCDGAHPACAQCVRAHKQQECAYDDGRGKTRTQALRERIMRLEAELERIRENGGSSSGMGGSQGREGSVFLIDPHAPNPPLTASTISGMEFMDFGEMNSELDLEFDIERPMTSLSDPSTTTSSAFDPNAVPFTSASASPPDDADEYAGGVHRTRTIRPRDIPRSQTHLRRPTPRERPSSGVFGYSANHPLVQQAQQAQQGYASPYDFQFNQGHGHGHSRTSSGSTGSVSPSASTVASGGHVSAAGSGVSPYSSFTDPLSLDLSPFHSPDPSMFSASSSVPGFAFGSQGTGTEREGSRERLSGAFTSHRSLSLDSAGDFGMGMTPETESTFLQLVLAHRDQVGLVLHPARVFPLPALQQRSQVLRDALTIMGARLARRACGTPVIGEQVEKALLRRAQTGVWETLSLVASSIRPETPYEQHQEGSASPQLGHGQGDIANQNAALDVIQTHVLLARYLFAEGRASEARVHASGAADLVLQLGLHQLSGAPSSSLNPGSSSTNAPQADYSATRASVGMFVLAPPTDALSLGERVTLFWAVFVLDRMLSASLGLPASIADDECVETRVDTPWPEEVEEYEHIPMETIQGSATLRDFFLHQGLPPSSSPAGNGGFAPLALFAKATALYAACTRAATNWGVHSPASPPPPMFIASGSASNAPGSVTEPAEEFTRLESCLARLAAALLPAHQLGAGLPEGERRKQVVLHSLVHASFARLHSRLARAGSAPSLEKALRAARAGAGLVRAYIYEEDYAILDPLFGSCWNALIEVFNLDQVQAGAATPGSPASMWVPQDLGALLAASARLRGSANVGVGVGTGIGAQGFSSASSTVSSGSNSGE